MKAHRFLPIHPLLRDTITLLAVMNVEFTTVGISPVYRFPWMNNTHLFFPLCDDPLFVRSGDEAQFRSYSSAYFVGPKLINDLVNFGAQMHVVGITFKPGAINRLLGIPTHELVNHDYEALSIWGKEISETEMKLRDSKSDNEILSIVESFLFRLLGKIKSPTPFDSAIGELLKYNGNMSMETFAGYACKSLRQFERSCQDKLGMSPKLFARLIRFGKAYALKEFQPDLRWSLIALQSGYYDQMHLIKDFKQFTGTAPGSVDFNSQSTKIMSILDGSL